ncbi:MFS general substrate transporter [Auriculariales sp. MPI-PUGE-AT-0066]|nr:MFS general substrate transporter [Auriculariales sp. MPI-PUGE-AT-0066]
MAQSRRSLSGSPTPTERTPLVSQIPKADDDANRPLPRFQIFLLCAARATEGLAFFTIFPYVNQMIHDSGGVPSDRVGFWSGLIESVFSFTAMVVMLFWGRASDRIGRKPVLVICLAGMATTTSLFGFASEVWQMIALRCLAGLFAGTVVTIRTMLTELSTAQTQARAFSLFAFSGNIGIFFGPLIGGMFSQPVDRYPWIFGNVKLFHDYPYLLPGLVTGSVTYCVALMNFMWLKETLPSQSSTAVKQKPPSINSVLEAPRIKSTLLIFLYSALVGLSFTAVIPVFYFTPVEYGGLGFTPAQISWFIAGAGFMQASWMLFVFPPVQRRIGTGALLRICAVGWPISFAFLPLLNVLLKAGLDSVFWTAAPLLVIFSSGVAMAYAGVQLALNDASPTPLALGTLNGIAMSLASGVRAFTPGVFTALYAYGVSHRILNGYLGIWILVLLACGFRLTLAGLPEKSNIPPIVLAREQERQRAEAEGRTQP